MRGKTQSSLTLSQRREQAFRYLARGYTNADIARELGVTPNTVYAYRKQFEKRLQEQKTQNPAFLQDVLQNTFKALNELEEIRIEAWKSYQTSPSAAMKKQFLDTIMKAQEQRAKLMGLFGVKQEYFKQVYQVKITQEKIIDFLRHHACEEDKKKLEQFLISEEIGILAPQPQLIEAKTVSA